MADPQISNTATCKDDSKEPGNLFSLFPKLDLKVPFLNHEKKAETKVKAKPSAGVVNADMKVEKRKVVRFPNNRITAVTLEAEVEGSGGRIPNPLVVWQAYALGGFIVLNWIWARWKERQDRIKKESADDNESTDGYQSPDDDES